ncbi:hypothetical protein B0H17DRAFT_12944 [Mycena rosella]|uniref:F-box domain-containing protein n=1 Tax=Mycena rosella TaxID=1033263 RepID=A0AAD7GSS6_MYCRO|nr:hypothetical protein B0H17DRAFT_12944 [Mycena rosella]
MAHRRRQDAAVSMPSVEEIAVREDLRVRITRIDAQILALESSLRSLRGERKVLERRLHAHTYPVLTLPNEIAAHIFVHFLPVYPRCPPLTGLFSPTTLGHICYKWREIALSTPALWRAIDIYLNDNAELQPSLRIVESWLTRSASCPLSIRLLSSGPALSDLDPVLQACVSHSARWEYMKINTIPLDYIGNSGSMPLLRSLAVEGKVLEGSGWIASSIDAPQLQKLTLGRYREIFAAMIPWGQLKTLQLTGVAPHQFMAILRHTVNLVHCKLNIIEEPENNSNAADSATVKLIHLEALVLVQWVDDPWQTGWFDSLTLPALRRLQIAEECLGRERPVDTLLSFIARSGCSLEQVFILTLSSLSDDAYRAALSSVPSVVFNRSLDLGNGLFAPDSSEYAYTDSEDGLTPSQSISSDSDERWGSSGE